MNKCHKIMDGSILHKCFTANLKNDYHSQTKNSWLYFNPLLKGCFHPSKYSLDGTLLHITSFLGISRWSFRSLRGKVWEIKTLTVSAKNHTQNISIHMEGNIRAPQSSGGYQYIKTVLFNSGKACGFQTSACPRGLCRRRRLRPTVSESVGLGRQECADARPGTPL